MNIQTLTFLGRDSGFGNENNSAYYETNDKLTVIDCGCTVFNKIINNFNLSKYSTIEIIITHLHNDHAGSLSQLILYIWFVLNKKTVVVSKCEHIKDYLNITGVPSESYELKDSLPNLYFIKTTHTPFLDSYGFCADFNDRRIVYTSDTNTLSPFLPYLEYCNELYIDVSRFGGAHIKIDDVLDVLKNLQDNNISIFLMHLDDKQYIKKITDNKFCCN